MVTLKNELVQAYIDKVFVHLPWYSPALWTRVTAYVRNETSSRMALIIWPIFELARYDE